MIALRKHALLFTAILASTLPLARAQNIPIPPVASTAPTDPNVRLPEYDVASVKKNKSNDGMMRVMNTPDGFSCANVPLQTLISNAYGIRQDLISGGPGWVDSTGFDVEAKVAGTDMEAFKKLTPRQRNALLQALLADRFKLKLHHETKVLPMYDMVVAKGGLKLKPLAPMQPPAADAPRDLDATNHRGMMTMGPGMLKGHGLTVTAVANNLSYVVHSTVVDKTGLTGDYDFDLKWTPEDAGPPSDNGSAESSASIFTAVQEQLGLKLQATKGPTDTLVIDHAELPSEN